MRKVIVVEDFPETRQWIAAIVRATFPGCDLTEAEDLRSGTRCCASERFCLALIDLGLPDGSGLDLLRWLRAASAETLCVVTTVANDDASIVAALSAGAHGYLLKDQPDELLMAQLSQLARGVPALSPPIARRMMEHFQMTGPCMQPGEGLTPREKEVLGLIARGLRVADAATALELAESTVASHVKAIYRKLDINSRAEAALHATRIGLLSQGGGGEA